MNTRLSILTITAAAGVALGGAGAWAQQDGETSAPDIATWNPSVLYRDAWRASMLLDADVYDQDNEEIGEVEDLIIGADGQIRKVIIEARGFLDIGDTHFAMNWGEVGIAGPDSVTVPFDEDNIEDYSVFGDMDDQPAEGRNWRVAEVMGDYATTAAGEPWGVVEDVIFAQDGTIEAIVVGSDLVAGFGGRYAFPWDAVSEEFDPAGEYVTLPYTETEIGALERFDYDLMEYPGMAP